MEHGLEHEYNAETNTHSFISRCFRRKPTICLYHAKGVMEIILMPNENKTPSEDITRFEKFTDSMTEAEYNYWYYHEATGKQQKLADTIRESEEEE